MQSKMTCAECSRSTSKFDVFNVLSLSIPSDQMSLVYILLQKLDGNPPTRLVIAHSHQKKLNGFLSKIVVFHQNIRFIF